ncbi:hypothetical protein BCR33DRAFT_468056 [Rhizoclosmatium globosum]|uniref:STIL N-terminal domain-containing protein n=1 Tax=Rhizoclosmatium globosum TaxID=329046 RepID=A0A1Y2BSA5_9FUNG|nr:hypothetical protein BCR33DRAFT_468056 [Rhizoclosmatium globosum]|eukprot:ORY37005.1 hypothetical protein BCR33DRAFT_468056 [Rhizoclosmatium globosum]
MNSYSFTVDTPFPLAIAFDSTSDSLTVRQLIPSFDMSITQINPIRLVPTTLSTSLLRSPDSTSDTTSIDFGYITIDQARHILLLDRQDRMSFQLPLVGLWLKNVLSPTHPSLQTLCKRY